MLPLVPKHRLHWSVWQGGPGINVLIWPVDPLLSILKTYTQFLSSENLCRDKMASWLGPGWDLCLQSIPFSCEATVLAQTLYLSVPQLKHDPALCPPQSLVWGTGKSREPAAVSKP